MKAASSAQWDPKVLDEADTSRVSIRRAHLHCVASSGLVSHDIDVGGCGPDELDAMVLADVHKCGVLRQKPIALRMGYTLRYYLQSQSQDHNRLVPDIRPQLGDTTHSPVHYEQAQRCSHRA